MVRCIQGVQDDDQEGEGGVLDTLGKAMDHWMHELIVWWHGGLGIAMPPCARGRERGSGWCSGVKGVC